MKPTIGRSVHYTLTEGDAQAINTRRSASQGTSSGNTAMAGQTYPATVVRVFEGATAANLQVQLDGNDTHWATSRSEGEPGTPGAWIWPPRV